MVQQMLIALIMYCSDRQFSADVEKSIEAIRGGVVEGEVDERLHHLRHCLQLEITQLSNDVIHLQVRRKIYIFAT